MRPLKLTVPGEYWDCQIYRGRLYLWDMEGYLSVYNWDHLIDDLSDDLQDKLVLSCAFSRSDYLYSPDFHLMFSDPEIVAVLRRKFELAADREWMLTPELLACHLYGRQINPFKEFPADTEIYNSKLYAALDGGLWSASAHRSDRKYPVSSRPAKLWDCGLFAIKAQGRRLALAAGDDGLWEYPLGNRTSRFGFFEEPEDDDEMGKLWQVHPGHSSLANWAFTSIYSSSFIDGGYMAAFGWDRGDQQHPHRVYKGIITQQAIFGDMGHGFSWGTQEKLYYAVQGGVKVVRYAQSKFDEGEAFQPLTHIPLNEGIGRVVGGGIVPFGVVVECENSLIVLRSDNTTTTIPKSAVRWRVFPRSQRYENHLHVIVDDCLEVYSFNHDYFVDQVSKLAGIAFRANTSWGRANARF